MGTSVLVAAIALSTVGQSINQADIKTQNEVFQRLWGTEFSWTFADLPEKGGVKSFRVPYSGHIYPDTQGGTIEVMRKYDRAFHRGRTPAASYERYDTTAFKEKPELKGLFGRTFSFGAARTPNWHGHCNGWSAAAIRHAEPQKSVYRNGVEFDTADIKALLAEIYIYNDTAMLAGDGTNINPGVLHAILGNWLGRGSHPVGMESDPGKEKWNYPMYAYASASAKRSNNRVEVKTNIAYAKDSDGEFFESPRIKRVKYFHYTLNLNDAGQITGGSYMRDSSIIDMVWVPLAPKQGGAEGNERGNPHININAILAIWRESVDEETRQKWYTVDPAPLDRIAENVGLASADDPVDDDEEATVETKLNGSATAAPVAAETDPRPAPTPDETDDDDAALDDAANDDPATEATTAEAEENDDVAPVVVQVDADSTPLPVGVGSADPDVEPIGN
ncbi:MAG TPA: hypothetical protein QF564_04035 [Pirellulaceae bacterium]|nr:hypothetical protein [Pirellulaceae bacterium]